MYTKSIKKKGAYACIEVRLYFKRLFGYYLIQVYMPSLLTVFISFVSFWIDHRAVPARISVGLLTVLTITTQTSGRQIKTKDIK
jgi:glycine receptor alpha-4